MLRRRATLTSSRFPSTIGTDARMGHAGSWSRPWQPGARVSHHVRLPLMFPPVAEGEALLVDGGGCRAAFRSARRGPLGAKRVLAVDVALPIPGARRVVVGHHRVPSAVGHPRNKRGQNDTISVAAGDTLVWLKIPKCGRVRFRGRQRQDHGSRGLRGGGRGGALVGASLGAGDDGSAAHACTAPVMPPLSSFIGWSGRGEVRRSKVATAVLGKLPDGSAPPHRARPGAAKAIAQRIVRERVGPTLTNRVRRLHRADVRGARGVRCRRSAPRSTSSND